MLACFFIAGEIGAGKGKKKKTDAHEQMIAVEIMRG